MEQIINNEDLGKVLNQEVTFKVEDLITYGVLNYDENELMAYISGYDLKISFNMRLINSLADAEACANGMADVFYKALMDELIERKADFINPLPEIEPIREV